MSIKKKIAARRAAQDRRCLRIRELAAPRIAAHGEVGVVVSLCEITGVGIVTAAQWLAASGYRPIPAKKLAKVEAAWAE